MLVFSKNKKFSIVLLFLLLVLLVLISSIISNPVSPERSLQAPNFPHILGTDVLGKDVLLQIIIALRYSLLLSISITIITAFLGTFASIVCLNYKFLNNISELFINTLISVPPFVVCLLLVSRWGGETKVLALGQFLAFFPLFVRLSYKEMDLIMKKDFAQVSLSLGNSYLYTLRTHALSIVEPKIKAQILSLCSISIGIESGFSYLGIGPPLPHTSLGTLLADSHRYWSIAPWYPLSSFLAFFLLIAVLANISLKFQKVGVLDY